MNNKVLEFNYYNLKKSKLEQYSLNDEMLNKLIAVEWDGGGVNFVYENDIYYTFSFIEEIIEMFGERSKYFNFEDVNELKKILRKVFNLYNEFGSEDNPNLAEMFGNVIGESTSKKIARSLFKLNKFGRFIKTTSVMDIGMLWIKHDYFLEYEDYPTKRLEEILKED